MEFSHIYSPRGKEIFPRKGMIVPAGSVIQIRGGFITLSTDHIVSFIVEEGTPYDQNPTKTTKLILVEK